MKTEAASSNLLCHEGKIGAYHSPCWMFSIETSNSAIQKIGWRNEVLERISLRQPFF
ncbi:hypothetical protein HMPREF9999_00674 [Alloprevotella sp. oral taxon 473 str. F0040]|nr:hypothetical protein HMPREF9999_00674 [Alloprevotella sp. oral taxon 473 str. F0040]